MSMTQGARGVQRSVQNGLADRRRLEAELKVIEQRQRGPQDILDSVEGVVRTIGDWLRQFEGDRKLKLLVKRLVSRIDHDGTSATFKVTCRFLVPQNCIAAPPARGPRRLRPASRKSSKG